MEVGESHIVDGIGNGEFPRFDKEEAAGFIKAKEEIMRKQKQPKYVGLVRCYYLTKSARYPHMTIGPTWPYSICILFFAAFCIGYFIFILSVLQHTGRTLKLGGISLIIGEMTLMGITFLKDSGIPKEIINRQRGALEDPELGFEETKEDSSDEEERNGLQKRNRSAREDLYTQGYCHACEYQMKEGDYHCDDCQVCIQGYDHHCVFFSKCIGKGNAFYFHATLVGCVFCFVFFAAMGIIDALSPTR